MVVGMATVFLILQIVISGGKLLIKIVNKLAPAEEVHNKAAATTQAQPIDAGTMAVLHEVVKQLTAGKGHIASVRKI